MSEKEKSVITFKAFDADFKCRDHQYKVGVTYEHEGQIKICNSGFHACENAFDVLNYYPLVTDNAIARFAKVVQSGEMKTDKDKTCSAKIHIEAELKLPEFIEAIFTGKWFKSLLDKAKTATEDCAQLAASGNDSQLAASGNYSKLAASGNDSQLAASGNDSQLAASGNYSKLAASGYASKLAASGYASKLAASGNYSKLAASGNYSQLAASGNDSKLAASGYASQLAASGKRIVLVSAERDCKVKGSKGTLICLTHYVEKEGKWVPSKLVTGTIGKNGLKADTWYALNKKGQFVKDNS